jgi:hypothetical protein
MNIDQIPRMRLLNFAVVKRAALEALPGLLSKWMPFGRRERAVYLGHSRHCPRGELGSFKVDLRTARWVDVGADLEGADAITLMAQLFEIRRIDAARRLVDILGIRATAYE